MDYIHVDVEHLVNGYVSLYRDGSCTKKTITNKKYDALKKSDWKTYLAMSIVMSVIDFEDKKNK